MRNINRHCRISHNSRRREEKASWKIYFLVIRQWQKTRSLERQIWQNINFSESLICQRIQNFRTTWICSEKHDRTSSTSNWRMKKKNRDLNSRTTDLRVQSHSEAVYERSYSDMIHESWRHDKINRHFEIRKWQTSKIQDIREHEEESSSRNSIRRFIQKKINVIGNNEKFIIFKISKEKTALVTIARTTIVVWESIFKSRITSFDENFNIFIRFNNVIIEIILFNLQKHKLASETLLRLFNIVNYFDLLNSRFKYNIDYFKKRIKKRDDLEAILKIDDFIHEMLQFKDETSLSSLNEKHEISFEKIMNKTILIKYALERINDEKTVNSQDIWKSLEFFFHSLCSSLCFCIIVDVFFFVWLSRDLLIRSSI